MTAVPEGGEFDFDAETRLVPGSVVGTFQVEITDRWRGMALGNRVIRTPNDPVTAIGTDEYQHGLVALVHPAPKVN